jgi:hypothetical protein
MEICGNPQAATKARNPVLVPAYGNHQEQIPSVEWALVRVKVQDSKRGTLQATVNSYLDGSEGCQMASKNSIQTLGPQPRMRSIRGSHDHLIPGQILGFFICERLMVG